MNTMKCFCTTWLGISIPYSKVFIFPFCCRKIVCTGSLCVYIGVSKLLSLWLACAGEFVKGVNVLLESVCIVCVDVNGFTKILVKPTRISISA